MSKLSIPLYPLLTISSLHSFSFLDIKKYYDQKLHPDILDFSDEKVYKNIFHEGHWCSTFQFTADQAQAYCRQVKPLSIEEISTITSIMRPRVRWKGKFRNYI